jgi:metallo-beta-lactamase family protein
MDIQFLGATGHVTGSCYLIRVREHRILLECGLIQGTEEHEDRNRDPFPFDVSTIDAVVLSHAHIDHSGRLPLLKKQGFDGPIYTHEATEALCAIMLRDAAYLQEKDAEWANRKRRRQGLPLLAPLYTVDDAEDVLGQFQGMHYHERKEILPGISVRLCNAGHILGAAIVELWLEEDGRECKLVFSGDLGFVQAPVMPDPEIVTHADMVMLESTYGDRLHRDASSTLEELRNVFTSGHAGDGNIIIPAFAVGRTQDILYLMAEHYDEWHIGKYRVFLDSPMAIEATEAYSRYRNLLDTQLFRPGTAETRLENLTMSRTSTDSIAINEIDSGAIVIAGSGMCTGGRVLHHLKHNLWKRGCQVVIVGYQAHGTLGRRLVDGADHVRIYGEDIKVNARIHTVGGLSAHADQAGLVDWYRRFEGSPRTYLVHGEPKAQAALAKLIKKETGNKPRIPRFGDRAELR